MTQEEKDLLLKDLCARQPYGVKVHIEYGDIPYGPATVTQIDVKHSKLIFNFEIPIENCKPYLRPMSNITTEDWLELRELIFIASDTKGKICFDGFKNISAKDTIKAIDYLTSHHFDFRGLIEKGLALKAPEGMYEIK